MERDLQLLRQGARQHNREPGAGEAAWPSRYSQAADAGPLISRQHLLNAREQGIRQSPAQVKTLHLRVSIPLPQGLQRHPQGFARAVQGQQQR
jgi:hypothetical protein